MTLHLEIINAAYLMDKTTINNLNTKELVPKMVFRRRLTQASKLCIELMYQINFTQGRVMYVSALGELSSTAKILNAILNNEGISPTEFQNSVYNTPVSYSSIWHENRSEIMTISSGNNSSDRLLKLGAIKALDGDEILLLATETLNIPNIEEINKCIEYLECAVALKVKITQKKQTITVENRDKGLPQSIALLIEIAKKFDKNKSNVIGVTL
ncbi:MAG: beta-ketoacyl synthase chain length factor [Arcobacteraceae bacterium]